MNIEAANNTSREVSEENNTNSIDEWAALKTLNEKDKKDKEWEFHKSLLSGDGPFLKSLEASFNEMTPIQQITSLPPLYFATEKEIAFYSWVVNEGEPCNWDNINNVISFLKHTQEDPNTTPLVKIVSEHYDDELSSILYTLHHVPEKDEAKEITIAPGVSVPTKQFNYHAIPDILTNTNVEREENDLLPGLDEETRILLSTAHSMGIKQLIDKKMGLKLQDISLPAQIQLLKYMTKVGDERFEKLCNGLNRVEPDVRLKLAEGFLAADFGEDFGDALIDIAESKQLTTKQVGEILNSVDSCRKSIKEIAGLYQNFDNGNFAKEYEKSSNERLTDALTAFKEIAKNGVASSDLDWAGKPEFNYDSAMEALKYEVNSLEIISGTLGDVNAGVKGAFAETVMHQDPLDQRLRRTVYNFYSPQHGYVLLYTRPEGSHSFDPMTEYGKMRSRYNATTSNVGVEASISLITNPVDPFSLPSPFRPDPRALKNPHFYDTSTMDKVSAIRLDREGRAREMAADDPNRDPINPLGMVSVDLAAIGDRADTPSGKIARLISTGGKLREEASKTDFSLNHNTKWFDQDRYGTSSGFKTLVNYIDTMAKQWCKEHAPENDAQSFSRLMKQARGRKVIRRAA